MIVTDRDSFSPQVLEKTLTTGVGHSRIETEQENCTRCAVDFVIALADGWPLVATDQIPLAPEFVRSTDGIRRQVHQTSRIDRTRGRLPDAGARITVSIRVWPQLSSPTVFSPSSRPSSSCVRHASRSSWSPNQATVPIPLPGCRRPDACGNLLDRLHTEHWSERREYHVEVVPSCGRTPSADSPLINVIHDPDRLGRRGYLSQCLGHRPRCPPAPTSCNWCAPRGRAGRLRSKASTLSRTRATTSSTTSATATMHLSKTLFVLNLLAFFMHQIFQLVDGLYQRVRTFFSSRRRRSGTRCAPPSGCFCSARGIRCWCA